MLLGGVFHSAAGRVIIAHFDVNAAKAPLYSIKEVVCSDSFLAFLAINK